MNKIDSKGALPRPIYDICKNSNYLDILNTSYSLTVEARLTLALNS